MNDSKLLAIDIEWAPTKAYVWKAWDESISPDQIIDHGHMLCFCAHWMDSKEFLFFSEWGDGREGMAKAALDLLSEADGVLTYNGDRYDIPKLTGEILLAGLAPPPPITSIDLLKAVKKFGFMMNRLAYIGPLLKVGGKVKHQGFNLWKGVLDGDPKSQRVMEKYCIQDVRLLKKLYQRIKPFIKTHPFFGTERQDCGTCGKGPLQKRGYRRTKSFIIQRLQCTHCGAWQEGTRKKV